MRDDGHFLWSVMGDDDGVGLGLTSHFVEAPEVLTLFFVIWPMLIPVESFDTVARDFVEDAVVDPNIVKVNIFYCSIVGKSGYRMNQLAQFVEISHNWDSCRYFI